jgi:type IV pilus assembly protein PilY1
MLCSKPRKHFSLAMAALLAICGPLVGQAQGIFTEDFSGLKSANDWYFFNGACLTAGNVTSASSPGPIPSCGTVFGTYYNVAIPASQKTADPYLVGGYAGYLGANAAPTDGTITPDPIKTINGQSVGQGALRFTNGYPYGLHENGAIVSKATFPTAQGVSVIFKTVTYLGDKGGAANDGADGLSFYLMDGSQPAGIGAWGGSLAYSCSNSNSPHDGLVGGYLGLGMDEYGNFLNGWNNTLKETGSDSTRAGDNTASGGFYQPGRIGIRGAGNIAWSWLNSTYPLLFPNSWTASQQQSAVQNTCASGVLEDYNGNQVAPSGSSTPFAVQDYQAIPGAYTVLSNVQIANETAAKRADATVIAYKLKLTQDGLLSLSYSYNGAAYQNVIAKQSIKNGPLPSSFRFGFAGSTGGSSNVHEILCFQATPSEQSNTSIGLDAKQAAKLANTTQAFLAYYFPSSWTGDLTANTVLYDSGNNAITVSTKANWDASCVLSGVPTGKTCPTTTASGLINAQDWDAGRTILSWNDSSLKGVAFRLGNLSNAQQSALNSGDATATSDRLNYLRGQTKNEVDTNGNGLFRPRTSILGDIVDSSPTWVGPPNLPYALAWSDLLYTSATPAENSGTQNYAAFKSNAAATTTTPAGQGTRLNVVYAGANDGMLHGFRAGSFDKNNNFVDDPTISPNDGQEVLAYVPGASISGSVLSQNGQKFSMVNTIHGTDPTNSNKVDSSIDYANTLYGHNFYVDAAPGAGDLFYNGIWHTWLVGGLGAGGALIYALDVTDPSTTKFSESNAVNIVLGEWTPASIKCQNESSGSNCALALGNTYGQPVIRRLHNGGWGAIFGNGFGSNNGDAGIFVMTVDAKGATAFYYLSTGVAAAAGKNGNGNGSSSGGNDGIAYVYSVDLDGDFITDYVYAGDLLGNIWRFDLTSNNPAAWKASASPLFTTPAGQPITTRPVVWIATPASGSTQRVMVDFGTGQKTPITNATPVSYASGTQYLYGIWDWDMDAWNAKSSAKMYSLTGSQSITTGNLTTQTVTTSGSELIGTSNPVCWKGSSDCSSGNTQFGWTLALPGTNEQVIYNPIAYRGAFVVNTLIPASTSITSCANIVDTGDTIAIDVNTGGAISKLFPGYKDAVGFRTDGSGSITTVLAGSKTFWITQTTDGPGAQPSGGGGSSGGGGAQFCSAPWVWSNGVCSVNPNFQGPSGKRVTWIQKR